MEREHVAAPEAAAGEAAGHPLHPGRQRAVGQRATARAVDQRGLIGQPLGVAEDEEVTSVSGISGAGQGLWTTITRPPE